MTSDTSSFLPRILSVFYAVFHDVGGTDIVYQVPEGLIATSQATSSINGASASPGFRSLSSDASIGKPRSGSPGETGPSRASSSSRNSLLAYSRETMSSYNKRSSSSQRYLFKFEDISRYVIPHSALCGRLVTCATRRHRIIGFPVELFNSKRYTRNFFRYNVCFVFERTADLSCYEPIVRKIGRVLTACEHKNKEESSFLSSPGTSYTIHAILEQLYEDLNSYSETSIPIDKFNSIELKIFPFYPNPPEVHDWQVPVALINLKKRMEDNWDLTMAKVCGYIDGTNHVSRIAYLADCDLELTRKAVRHLLYYQVIMMIDIFQFSNMYTLCRSIQWLADEVHVQKECGPYVTRADAMISEWPELLHLYSRLKPGITVYEWMERYDTHRHGIDPRRFVSFGVIKGFLRRVHRWPVLLPASPTEKERDNRRLSPTLGRKRGKSLNMTTVPILSATSSGATTPTLAEASVVPAGLSYTSQSSAVHGLTRYLPTQGDERTVTSPTRRASVAEKYLEQFRREIDNVTPPNAPSPTIVTSPRLQQRLSARGSGKSTESGMQRRHSLVQPSMTYAAVASLNPQNVRNSIGALYSSTDGASSNATLADYGGGEGSGSGVSTPTRPRVSRSPTSFTSALPGAGLPGSGSGSGIMLPVPSGLKDLLDGTRHTDELGVTFEIGWPTLERYLVTIGGGKGDGDFGRVQIIFR